MHTGFGLMVLDGLAGLLPLGWRRASLRFEDGDFVLAAEQLNSTPSLPKDGFRSLLLDAAREWATAQPGWNQTLDVERDDSGARFVVGETRFALSRDEVAAGTFTDAVIGALAETAIEVDSRRARFEADFDTRDGTLDPKRAEFVTRDGKRLSIQILCVFRGDERRLYWPGDIDCDEVLKAASTRACEEAEGGAAALFSRCPLVWHPSMVRPLAWLLGLRLDAAGLISGYTTTTMQVYAARTP